MHEYENPEEFEYELAMVLPDIAVSLENGYKYFTVRGIPLEKLDDIANALRINGKIRVIRPT